MSTQVRFLSPEAAAQAVNAFNAQNQLSSIHPPASGEVMVEVPDAALASFAAMSRAYLDVSQFENDAPLPAAVAPAQPIPAESSVEGLLGTDTTTRSERATRGILAEVLDSRGFDLESLLGRRFDDLVMSGEPLEALRKAFFEAVLAPSSFTYDVVDRGRSAELANGLVRADALYSRRGGTGTVSLVIYAANYEDHLELRLGRDGVVRGAQLVRQDHQGERLGDLW